MPIIRLDSTDPYLNLAIEAYLLDRAGQSGPLLLLWRNAPCIVIGRHQNPWIECDLRLVRRDRLPLVRRISGGGAVYHDAGNTNFSFIAPSSEYDQERHFRVVIAALSSLGIDAWKSERNDLRVGERKISGNAFRHARGRSLHHGTLLLAANLDRLTAYLTPGGALIDTKATASVRSAVMNLAEIRPDLSHEELCEALSRSFAADYGSAQSVREPAPDGSHDPAIARHAAHLAGWPWVYGHTPAFVRRLSIPAPSASATQEIAIAVRHGLIVKVEGAPPGAHDTLTGIRYSREAVRAAIGGPARDTIRLIAEAID